MDEHDLSVKMPAEPGHGIRTCLAWPPGALIPAMVLGALVPLVASAEPARRSPRVRPSEIAGTVHIYGCRVEPHDLALEAQTLGVAVPGEREVRLDRRVARRRARVESTADAHLLHFSIRGLKPATLYRLQIGFPPSPCGRIFWRGPEGGLATSGVGEVAIEGIAARTTVEVRRDGSDEWVGAADLQFTDPVAAARTLRWSTSLLGVVAGELQVSTEPFPPMVDGRSCAEPEGGIVYRQPVPAGRPGTWRILDPLDFRSLLTPRRSPDSTDPIDSPDGDGGIDGTAYERLLAGAPIYVRVVPLSAAGPACDAVDDGAPGWVMMAKLPTGRVTLPEPEPTPPLLEAATAQYYGPPFPSDVSQPGAGHPSWGELAYLVVKKHTLPPVKCEGGPYASVILQKLDPLGCVLVNAGKADPGATLHKGDWFYFTPGSGGGGGGGGLNPLSELTTTFGNFATGTLDAGGLVVDYLSGVWEDVKEGVAEVVVDVLTIVPGIDKACEELASSGAGTCQEFVKKGLETGLASMGIPPSLPSWEQLKNEGVEYLAAEIATEIEKETGIPSDLTEDKLKEIAQTAVDEMTKKRGGSGPQYDWVIPFSGFHPAVWSTTMRKNGADPVSSGLSLVKAQSGLYLGGVLPVPTEFPSSGLLRMPLVLPPNLEGIDPPLCISKIFAGVTCQPASFLSEPLCLYQGTQGSLVTDCSGTNWVEIYYRDMWFWSKLQKTSCVDLKAQTAKFVPGVGYFPSPAPPFVDFARVRSRVGDQWDGPFHVSPQCQ